MAWTTKENDFPLDDHWIGSGSPAQITSVDDLVEWMENAILNFESEFGSFEKGTEYRGRGYVASTIKYHSEQGLVQTGSAPAYFGDLWTLATCRKDMRSSSNFTDLFFDPDNGVHRPKRPVFILPFSSRNQAYDKPGDKYQRFLASAALVTHGFSGMGKHAEFLIDNFSGPTVEKRLSHGGDQVAEERGDCHADWNAEVHLPPDRHQHGNDSPSCGCGSGTAPAPEDHPDNRPDHIKCVSIPGYWISWNEPTLALDIDNEFRTKTIHGPSTLHERIEPVKGA